MPLKKKRRRRRFGLGISLLLALLFSLPVVLPHLPFLDLPFFWDEAGQFVPAALDLYQRGAWIPRSATPNVHPPGVMAYLAAIWSVTGYSIAATRLAMLTLASLAALVVFLLAVEMCQEVKGIPALVVIPLLCASPLFYTQAMMAQLDLPAMLLTSLALLLFLKDKPGWTAAACTLLVLVKETGLLVPLLFGGWLLAERRARKAAWFLLPVAALGVWLLVLGRATGHVFGNSEFTRFNVFLLAHPVRMATAMGKRLYYLFFGGFHWIGTLGILLAWWQPDTYRGRAWKLGGALVTIHVVFFGLLGGAMLERYLLPVLPIVYIAMVAGWSWVPSRWRVAGQLALIAGVGFSNFQNPPYPFPFENNLAMADFVRLHVDAAQFLERRYPTARVTSVWPATAEFSRPDFGYVRYRHPVRELPDFSRATLRSVDPASVQVLVFYSRDWNPASSLMRIPQVAGFWRRFFGYREQASGAELEALLGLKVVGIWSRGGQWIEVYAKP
ncbi:MAG: hypothetical protein HY013_17205 [Candidatus Solibacter usitatus]|nr:hypothetical protein [Candidatus Solibacter usitatus]